MGLRGRSKCSRCKAVWYCSRECQVKHWATHKTSCRDMVQTTVCNGEVLMKDRELLVCDEAKIMADCRQAAKELADDINSGK